MEEITTLRRLVEEAHISISALAQFCNCAIPTMHNYLKGTSLPNGARLVAIREGLQKYKELMQEILGE